MAYRFMLSENFETGAARIAVEQASLARRLLAAGNGEPEQIHEARKALKRLRALLRLVRPGLGEKAFARENAAARDAAKSLARLRNLDAIRNTIEKLEAHFGINPDGLTARLRGRLAKQHRHHEKKSPAAIIDGVRQRLNKAETRLVDIRLQPAGTRMICKGLAISYSSGQRRIKKAYASGLDDDFHNLRKAVQQHWRHMQLMKKAWPKALAARVAAARELSQILGDDHDLSELLAFVMREKCGLTSEDRIALTGLCAARQHQLRGLARPRLERLYGAPAPEIRDRFRLYWRQARKMSYMEQPRRSGLDGDARIIALKA